jgi:hypothetical protein
LGNRSTRKYKEENTRKKIQGRKYKEENTRKQIQGSKHKEANTRKENKPLSWHSGRRRPDRLQSDSTATAVL